MIEVAIMSRRSSAFLACWFAAASLAAGGAAAAESGLTFAVNEGVTYRGNENAKQYYKAIADELGKQLKTRVNVEIVADYPTLEKGLAAKAYDIAFVHPTHIALAPVKRGDYALAAVSKAHTGYKASFLSKVNAPVATPAELAKVLVGSGKPVGVPDANSITTWLVKATAREAVAAAKTSAPQFKYTRYQESIPYMVENGFVDVAATASEAIVKDWTAAGGKVIATSRAVPIKNLIVATALGKDQLETIRSYFVELVNSTEGQAKLEKIGLRQGFITYDQNSYVALAAWLGL